LRPSFYTSALFISSILNKIMPIMHSSYLFQDYDGQARAEKLSRIIITLFGVSYDTYDYIRYPIAYVHSSSWIIITWKLNIFIGSWFDLGIRYSTILADDIHFGCWISHGSINHCASVADVPSQTTRLAKSTFRSYY